MFLRISLLTVTVVTFCLAKPPSVVQYLGVPGNTRGDPALQFVDLGEPVITEYQEEHVGLDIPQPPRPQAPVTLEPLLIEYTHNAINDVFRVPPKQIQVVEVSASSTLATPVQVGRTRRVRQLPAGTKQLPQDTGIALNDLSRYQNNPFFNPTTLKPSLDATTTKRVEEPLNVVRYQNNPFFKLSTTTTTEKTESGAKTKRNSLNGRVLDNIKTFKSYYTPHRNLKIRRLNHAAPTTTTTTTAPLPPATEVYDEDTQDVEYDQPQLLDEEEVEPKLTEENVNKIIEEAFKKQAESAKYEFASNIDDAITGNQHHREETRDGVSVKGSYSYSDGYFKRTVHYVADDKGYRILKMEQEPLGDGPEYNPDGEAKVETYIAGKSLNYKVTEDDYLRHRRLRPQEIEFADV